MVFIIGPMGRLTPIQLGKEEIFTRNQFSQDVLITRCIIGFIDSAVTFQLPPNNCQQTKTASYCCFCRFDSLPQSCVQLKQMVCFNLFTPNAKLNDLRLSILFEKTLFFC